ncbi:hypothetical protein [Hoeflea poritis]|uniref:Uncharacterized protein n=1 Tax=Hoeflea poritis TaxID=2993659 RepID=A0ABT4VPR0_9HYPH|nr:hypothetical protein [Hoeflea poritis]MDA4846703.1 hypothetical protein [Hoeflea poritis]
MERKTNRLILRFALLPMAVFVGIAFAFPEIFEGSSERETEFYLVYVLWIIGCIGAFVFWGWGVVPHAANIIFKPLEIEQEKGWLKPGGHGEAALRNYQLLKFLRIYIKDDDKLAGE